MTRYATYLLRDRVAAQDLVQDVCLKVIQAADQYKAGTNFGGWVHVILHRTFLSRGRKASNRYASKTCHIDDLAFKLPDLAPAADSHCYVEEIISIMNKLRPLYRNALKRIILDQCPVAEVAAEFGISPQAMKSTIRRARLRLQLAADLLTAEEAEVVRSKI